LKKLLFLDLLFHLVPGVTETTTRLPLEHPWASSPDDPLVAKLVGICLVLFLVGTTFQIIALRKKLS
jgi:hypothetical protein